MVRPADKARLLIPSGAAGSANHEPSRPAPNHQTFTSLAVCDPGGLEERLRKTARGLGQDISFERSFGAALEQIRRRHFDLLVLGKVTDGAPARDFVREVRRVDAETVIVIAAPGDRYQDVIEVMVEGAYDFLPDDAADHQLKLMLGRAMDHCRLRRKSDELERALDMQTSSLRQRLQELALLNEMARDMSSVPDLDEVLRRALRRILDAFGSECGSFLILDPERNELVVRAATGEGAEDLIGRRRKLGQGVAGKVAREGHPVLVTDIEKDSRFKADALGRAQARHYRSRSFIAVPVIHHKRLLGELNITEKPPGEPFTQDDLRLLAILGGHAASAINGALAAEELKRANERLARQMCSAREHLRATSEKLTQAEGLAQAVVSSLPAAVAAFDADLTVTFANAAAEDLLGLEQGGSLRGHPARSELARLGDAAVDVLEHGATRRLRSSGRRAGPGPDGGLSVVVAPLRLPDSRIAGGTVVATPRGDPLITRWEK